MLTRMFHTFAFATLILVVMAPTTWADYLADVTVSRESPASLPLHYTVEVACDWEWTGGPGLDDPEVDIHAIPLTNGSISPGAFYWGTGPYAPGFGRVWPSFTIESGETVVDEIQLIMELAPPEHGTILEMRIPVDLHFGPHAFYGIDYDFDSPERMQFGQYVTLDFNWRTNHSGGHRIVIRPLTNGNYTPNMVTGGSGILTGTSGSATRYFSILQGESDFAEVDGIVIELYNSDWSELLYEFRVPADYRFEYTAVQNVVLYPDTPASMVQGDNVTITFDYRTDHPTDPVMYAVPQTGGVHSPGFLLGPSYPLAPGIGSGTNTFSIDPAAGLVDVDEILFSLHDFFDESIIIYQFRMPVYYHFSDCAIWDVTYEPTYPAVLGDDTYVNVEITYFNGYEDAGWLFNTPLSAGVMTPDLDGDFQSVAFPGMNPFNTHYFTVIAGDRLVDRMHFEMTSMTKDELWLSYFQDVWFFFGQMTNVAPVFEVPGAVTPVLHQCFPNPFNPRTTIGFDLPEAMVVGVMVYDLRGRLVNTLVEDQVMTAGANQVTWDGKDDSGRSVAAGVYLYRLEAGEFSAAKRMTLVK